MVAKRGVEPQCRCPPTGLLASYILLLTSAFSHLTSAILFYRPFNIQGIGFFPCVCIDIECAPEVFLMHVGGIKVDADI